MPKKLSVCFFAGSDAHTHILLNYLLKKLTSDKFEKTVFFPQRPSGKRSVAGELGEYLELERTILPEIIYPLLSNGHAGASPAIVPVSQYGKYYDAHVEVIDNVNDPAFISEVAAKKYGVGLSIRCYQKFQEDIINAFSLHDNQFGLLNLHPGTLPMYRGVMVWFREMADRRSSGRYSLHFVDPFWDRGDILLQKEISFDLNKSVLWNFVNASPIGAQFIFDALEMIRSGNAVNRYPQDKRLARYWSYPTADEIKTASSNGIRLFDYEEVLNKIGNLCGGAAVGEA